MAKLTKQLMVYDPVARADRGRTLTIEGPELLLDCLDRDTSCLDLQMLGEAADSSPTCESHLQGNDRSHQARSELALMPRYADTVMVNGRPVEVTIDAPEGVSVMNLQELAEKAWRSVNKEITIGKVTVKVWGFRR